MIYEHCAQSQLSTPCAFPISFTPGFCGRAFQSKDGARYRLEVSWKPFGEAFNPVLVVGRVDGLVLKVRELGNTGWKVCGFGKGTAADQDGHDERSRIPGQGNLDLTADPVFGLIKPAHSGVGVLGSEPHLAD